MANFAKLSEILRTNLSLPGTHMYLVRHGQSLANHAGTIYGWTDSKLSVKGREQANKLFKGFHQNIDKFTKLHSSDLVRCLDTLNLSLGFPNKKIQVHTDLRQMNYGDDEGVHFDSLPEELKKKVNSFEYQAPNGENWTQVKARAMNYLKQLQPGHHLIYTHGGLMCTLTYHIGFKSVVPNCSVVGIELCPQKKELKKLNFIWEFEE